MSATPMPTAPMRWRGVVIDKLIPSLFSVDIIMFTSTKSEHGDSPWCDPITPLITGCSKCMLPYEGQIKNNSRYYVRFLEAKSVCLWTDHHTWWGGQTPEYLLCFVRVLTIDVCGRALTLSYTSYTILHYFTLFVSDCRRDTTTSWVMCSVLDSDILFLDFGDCEKIWIHVKKTILGGALNTPPQKKIQCRYY
jgi:hypothetical protein